MNNIQKKGGKIKIVVISLIIFLILLAVIPYYSYKNFLNTPVSKNPKEVEFQVRRGANSSTIIDGLYKKGLVKSRIFAKMYVKKLNMDKNLRPGIYKLNTTMTPMEIFVKLSKGAPDFDVVNITFPEGYNVKQIAAKLKNNALIKDEKTFIAEAQNGNYEYDFLKDIPANRPSRLEGYLFPDTYEIKKGLSEHDIIVKMLDRFDSVYKTSIQGNINSENQKLDDIITMASIVEREAKVDSERPLIAAVFYNRLKKDMELQSCATIQYALGVTKEKLYYKDLEVNSPYNTYKHKGLPVGPISNPGLSSIKAALNPSKVDYLFFVLKAYNGDGSHNFAKTDVEFEKYKSQLK